jgi:hypothetical protein
MVKEGDKDPEMLIRAARKKGPEIPEATRKLVEGVCACVFVFVFVCMCVSWVWRCGPPLLK